jgi:hypothetical protein
MAFQRVVSDFEMLSLRIQRHSTPSAVLNKYLLSFLIFTQTHSWPEKFLLGEKFLSLATLFLHHYSFFLVKKIQWHEQKEDDTAWNTGTIRDMGYRVLEWQDFSSCFIASIMLYCNAYFCSFLSLSGLRTCGAQESCLIYLVHPMPS